MQPHFYRPQRSWAKVMFLQASVILSTGGGGGLPQCMLGCHPPGADPLSRPPRAETPPPPPSRPPGSRHPLGADTPWSRHSPGPGTPPRARYPPQDQVHPPGPGTPLDQVPPQTRYTPLRYGHCCGRYTSYWNAFLFKFRFLSINLRSS